MDPGRLTRRDALHLSGLTLVGFAGCAKQASEGPPNGSDDRRETATATERQYSHSLDAPETRKIRNSEGEPAVRSSAHSPERDDAFSESSESPPGWDHEYWFVTSPDERNALEFPRTTTGVDAATDFIADTDLSEETLLVQQYISEDCTTVQLKQLEWEARERGPEGMFDIRAEYEGTKRDANCEHTSEHDSGRETEHVAQKSIHAILSRIPVVVENVGAFGYGW